MIRYVQGNLLESRADAIVNTVNELGVMGKGLALQVREAFPESAAEYVRASRRGDVHVGRMCVTRADGLEEPRWIVHFPTKKHWRDPSRLEWVRDGLDDLVRVVRDLGIRSIAIPPLGCGNGGLEWGRVRDAIERACAPLVHVDVRVYEPDDALASPPKRTGVVELTPARALVADAVRRYGELGLDCTHIEVQKLAWFLQRALAELGLPDVLRLRFVAQRYGPYSDRLRHLLDALDGSYLHCARRLSEAKPLEPIWFETSMRFAVESYLASDAARAFVPALERVAVRIDGFESPLGLELLATVDWLLEREQCAPNVEALRTGLRAWPDGAGERKLRILDDRLLGLALERLAPARESA